jgi:two-component system CheB/CheR fusion protein
MNENNKEREDQIPKESGLSGREFSEVNPVAESLDTSLGFSVVGIGASAGGLEALQEFFKNTPDDPGVAFVVVQHLSPDYKSLMDELLARYTNMSITRVEDGTPVEPDHLYLIPPRKNMTIFRGKLYLTEQDHSRMMNMPIDIFMRSLAQDQGKNAIGVILSGTGSDGTLGIRAIKEHGGMVIAQDDRSAKFDGMPRSSISTGMVDYILTPGEMPEALLNYVKHPFIQKTDNIENQISREEDHLSKIIMIIRDHTGIDFSNYKESTVIRRLEKRISINRYDNIEDYVDFLAKNKREINILYRELLIGVTRFFRDQEAFKQLQEKVLPDLVSRGREHQPLRIWSIGCSTGEEAYSLAMMLQAYMENNNVNREVKLFATDIDKDSIEYAGVGIYPESIVSDVSPDYLGKYFTKREEGYQISEKIRRMVIFAPHNILRDPPFSKMDLIVCRNMLIYLNNEVQQKILSMLYFSLNKDGYLFLGSSESVGEVANGFRTIDTRSKIYQHQAGYKPPENQYFRVPTVQKKQQRELKNVGSYLPEGKTHPPRLENIFDELLGQFVPPSVIVDENYNLIHTIHSVNDFLKLPVGQVNLNLLKMLPDELATMASSILRRARKNQELIVYENIKVAGLDYRPVRVSGRRLDDHKNKEIYFMVSFQFEETNTDPEVSGHRVQTMDADSHYQERIEELEKELQYTKENLQATVEELETSNEELQSSNEELIASNEELQSTNEELQSVNEELHTVNAEHQEKIEELTQLNNDMNNLLKNTNIGTLFLDSNMKIRKLTEVAAQITHIRDSDIGRPLRHISLDHIYDGFMDDVEGVMDNLKSREAEITDDEGAWYLVRMLPYRTQENAVDGVIITFIDITDLKKSQTQIQTLNTRLEQAMRMGELAWWEWDYKNNRVYFGDQKATLLGYDPGEIGSGYEAWTGLLHPEDYDATMQAMKVHLQGRSSVYEATYRLKHKKGGYLWFKDKGGVVERDEKGKPFRLTGIVMNITREKEIEEEKNKTYDLIFKTLEYNPVASTVVDESGKITFANKKAQEVLGITQKQIRERNFDDVKWEITDVDGNPIPSEDLPFSRVMETQKPVHRFKHYIKLPDQGKRLLCINGAPMLDSYGKARGVVFTLEDISNHQKC